MGNEYTRNRYLASREFHVFQHFPLLLLNVVWILSRKLSNPWREQSIISVFVYQRKSMSCWVFREREREKE